MVVFSPSFSPVFFKVNKGKYSTSLPYHKMFIITEKTFKLTSTSTVRLEWSWNSSKCPIFSFCRMATFPFSSIILYKLKKIFDFSPLLLSFFPSFFPSPFFYFFFLFHPWFYSLLFKSWFFPRPFLATKNIYPWIQQVNSSLTRFLNKIVIK